MERMGMGNTRALGTALWLVLLGQGCAMQVDRHPGEDDSADSVVASAAPLAGYGSGGMSGTVWVEIAGVGTCTGTLVGKSMVLTASHCFNELDAGTAGIASVKINYALDGNRWRCVSGSASEGACTGWAYAFFQRHRASGVDLAQDLAVLFPLLGGEWSNLQGLPLAYGLYSGAIQQAESYDVWGVGYNRVDRDGNGSGAGVMRYTWGYVDLVTNEYLVSYTDSLYRICRGDSGGPWYLEGTRWQFAVTSRALREGRDCAIYPGWYGGTRINEAHMQDINGWRASMGVPACFRPYGAVGYWACQ